jgi:hypothetical protein
MADLDDPATFRGQLQRGRGSAVRRAPSEPRAGEAVYECVIDDPRWDRQVESRAAYLAGLVWELRLSLTPIEEHLVAFDGDEPDDLSLLLDVVALLAMQGREDAVGVLRRYVTGGKYWNEVLNTIVFVQPTLAPDVRLDLVDDALGARTFDELRDVAENGDESWMGAVREHRPQVLRFFDRIEDIDVPPAQPRPGAASRQSRRTLRDLPRDELLQSIAGRGIRRRTAFEELGRRGDLIVLDLVEDPNLRNPAGWLPGASQALRALGAAAVPRARTWLSAGVAPLAELGLHVVAGSGDQTDVPDLMSALRRAFDDDDLWCFAEIPAEGLGRLQVAEAAPLVSAAWEKTVHSYARGPFLTALRGCAPQAAEALAEEGLRDCEPTVQEIARS